MHTAPQIPGVSVEVFKQNRRLAPEADGCLGQLWSGYATILAVVDPAADATIGLLRDGADNYIQQKNWLMSPDACCHPIAQEKQKKRLAFVADRSFASGSLVYGVKIPLRVNHDRGINVVCYPENMLIVAQLVRYGGQFTGRVHVWKIALISQDENMFLTIDLAYDTIVHRDSRGQIRAPRLRAHRQLEKIIAAGVPADADLPPLEGFTPPAPPKASRLAANEGITERWYHARNLGCIITPRGAARVHWTEIPPRPRRRFLVPGERVRFAELRRPPKNLVTIWRTARKAQFKWQAYGVETS